MAKPWDFLSLARASRNDLHYTPPSPCRPTRRLIISSITSVSTFPARRIALGGFFLTNFVTSVVSHLQNCIPNISCGYHSLAKDDWLFTGEVNDGGWLARGQLPCVNDQMYSSFLLLLRSLGEGGQNTRIRKLL